MRYIKTIALLALVTLFAACSMLNEPAQPATDNSGAAVRVTIGGSDGRTILPNIDIAGGFSKLELSLVAATGNAKAPPAPTETSWENYTNKGYIDISVPSGDWVITAKAYVKVSGADYAAAKGSASLTVYEWGSNSVNIAINAPETGGTGTFAYTVNYPAPGSATLELKPFTSTGGLGAAVITGSVTAAASNTRVVASGIYFLTVTATSGGKTVTRNEVVHIYNRLTTTADYVFTKLDFDADASLRIGGTAQILLNGEQTNDVELYYSFDPDRSSPRWANFSGSTWEFSLDNLEGASTMYFWVEFAGTYQYVTAIPIPLNDTTNISLGTINITFDTTPISPNTWKDVTISAGNWEQTYDWYRLDVNQGQTYYIWWNDSNEGDGSKTANVYVYAYYNDGRYIDTGNTDSAWYFPASFTAESFSTVYFQVQGQREPDRDRTYAIAYSTQSNWHSGHLSSTVPLSTSWIDGSLDQGDTDLYALNVTAGHIYTVQWDDAYAYNGKTAYVRVSAYHSDGNKIFDQYQGYSDPPAFIAKSTGTVYILVNRYSGYGPDYAIRYSEPTVTQLTANTWNDGFLSYDDVHWYSLNVTGDTPYYFWKNTSDDGNGYFGDGSKTASLRIETYYSNGEPAWPSFGWYEDWASPTTFEKTDTIFIKVSGDYGDYAIAYSTSETRPAP